LKEWTNCFVAQTLNEQVEEIFWWSIWDMARQLNQKEAIFLRNKYKNLQIGIGKQ